VIGRATGDAVLPPHHRERSEQSPYHPITATAGSNHLRFHVLLLPNIGWEELRARALRLEELGIEVAALADHVVDWANPTTPWFETWTVLPALAEATRTIRLSTVVSQIPLRNPAMLTRQVFTLDHISNGRIELGLGTGLTTDPASAMIGVPNWEPAERVERFGEYVELIGRLFADEVITYEGRYYRVDGAARHMSVQRPHPPILVAALGPRMMRLAAQHADIWNSLSFLPTFDEQLAETRARCEAIDAACDAIGREPSTLRRSYTMFDAQARSRGGAIGYYESREQFIDQVSRLAEVGISDVGLYYPLDPAQVDAFETIAAEVLPDLRSAYPSR
jgi:alkanesulfonate monooxygenase SsuD/methylene tetrahydromethanopterin reductase-like flavin-dependent oxidoreductase (luciferase family)